MSQARRETWTEAAFFAWHERQEQRYELVDGAPQAMTGANQRHNLVATNVYDALRQRLRGGPCRPTAFNTAVRIPGGNIRYPDLLVDCGPYRPEDYAASEPVLVVEVLSPSTKAFDQTRKLEEYRAVPTIRHMLVLDPEAPRAQLHSRGADGQWAWTLLLGEAAEIALPALGITLPLGECYSLPAA
jgi:Uma2 family endonuclease